MNTKRPLRFFNTTGPCNPDDHYMLPPANRLVGAQLNRYISDKLYWVLHAPRQTGKTTFLQSWMKEINAGDEAISCYVSVERCQGVEEAERAMPALCSSIQESAIKYGLPIPELSNGIDPYSMLSHILLNWSILVAPKPLVILFDEVDVLVGETMVSFLRQLRGGFATRGIGLFPVSIVLVGMRDLKDYITASKDGIAPNPGSPFNIKADSAVLANFQKEDIVQLFAQRTTENGQLITQEALDYVYDRTKGQPWIVNNLFMRATMRILDKDSTETVTLAHVEEACQQMILARETHLDALAYRLKEPGVRDVIQTIITGDSDPNLTERDSFRLCLDLGLVAFERGTPVIANPIYREVIVRQLTFGQQSAISEPEWVWELPDGSLDMNRIMAEFQSFWRQHADLWEGKSELGYTEAFPHLLLMAFLQRVLNGGGKVDREYAAGRGRMDLHIEYNSFHYLIEIKLIHWYQTPALVRKNGLEQIRRYREKFPPSTPCWLVIFDRRNKEDKTPWDERITWEVDGDINVLGC